MKSWTLEIGGMSCGHCVSRVTKALSGLPGLKVGTVQVGKAEVEVGEAPPSKEALETAIAEVGFHLTGLRS